MSVPSQQRPATHLFGDDGLELGADGVGGRDLPSEQVVLVVAVLDEALLPAASDHVVRPGRSRGSGSRRTHLDGQLDL